jgi:uncharacterized membrane protein YraQ (UPF0718 family)
MRALQMGWDFFQKQILGMNWLNALVGNLLSSLGVDVGTRIGGSVQFFLYDTIKILILLSTLIYIISYVQSHFPPERTKKILGRFHGVTANTLSALLGTVTPFCSCSSIPLFIGFTNAGLPLSVTFSFLISSPLVDLGSVILLMSVFGAKVAVAYVIVGLVLAVACGTILGRLGLEQDVQKLTSGSSIDLESSDLTPEERSQYAFEHVKDTVARVYPYVLIGVGIGAVIHNWIPAGWVQSVLGAGNPLSVILATAVGVPMYADIFGTIPVADALYAKGVGLGTILSFMMAVTALSLPSIVMLSKVVKPRLLGIFVGIVTLGIIAIGYVFNAFGSLLV